MLYWKMPYLVDYLMNISETVKMKKYKVIEMKLPTDMFFFPNYWLLSSLEGSYLCWSANQDAPPQPP